MALEEWKLRLTSAKAKVEVEAEHGKKTKYRQVMLDMAKFCKFVQSYVKYGKFIQNFGQISAS